MHRFGARPLNPRAEVRLLPGPSLRLRRVAGGPDDRVDRPVYPFCGLLAVGLAGVEPRRDGSDRDRRDEWRKSIAPAGGGSRP
jgi:hypothetical protein